MARRPRGELLRHPFQLHPSHAVRVTCIVSVLSRPRTPRLPPLTAFTTPVGGDAPELKAAQEHVRQGIRKWPCILEPLRCEPEMQREEVSPFSISGAVSRREVYQGPLQASACSNRCREARCTPVCTNAVSTVSLLAMPKRLHVVEGGTATLPQWSDPVDGHEFVSGNALVRIRI